MKDHVIDEKEDYKEIGLRGFDYSLFEEEEGGGKREGLDRYSYLKHLIKLWPGDWVRHMEKMNQVVCMKNRVTLNGGGKWQVKSSKGKSSGNILGVFYRLLLWEERAQALE